MRNPLSRIVFLLSLALCFCSCQNRVGRICARFGINLQRIHYKVVEKTDNWYPNGDGELFVRLSLSLAQEEELNEVLSQMRLSGAIELPMFDQHAKLISGKNARSIKSLDTGIYLIDIDKQDSRNYSLIV